MAPNQISTDCLRYLDSILHTYRLLWTKKCLRLSLQTKTLLVSFATFDVFIRWVRLYFPHSIVHNVLDFRGDYSICWLLQNDHFRNCIESAANDYRWQLLSCGYGSLFLRFLVEVLPWLRLIGSNSWTYGQNFIYSEVEKT